VWRTSRAGRETQRFGEAFIRGYRCIRRLAAGPMSDLFVGESERAGTLVALKVARDLQNEQHEPLDMFRRFLQEYEIASASTTRRWCACTTLASVTTTPGW